MSKYSGKCDFYDTVVKIHKYTLDELKHNVIIYVGENKEPLQIDKIEDLIPYYPYNISFAYVDNVHRKAVIHLSNKSLIDMRERDNLNLYLKLILRYYNKCKRKNIEFNVEEAVDKLTCSKSNRDTYIELANRVKLNGKKANIDGIHLESYDFYRKELVDEMIKNGLNPLDYGYEL